MGKIAVGIGQNFDSPIGDTVGLADLVSILLSNAVVIAGVMLLFLALFGGFSMIAGAGQSDPQSVARGQKALTAAVAGFVIVFTAYWIIQIVELITGLNITSPPL